MANIQSAQKRVRKSRKRKVHNKYYHKTARNAIKRFKNLTDKKEAQKKYPELARMVDKLVKRKVIHKNKAANIKSSLSKHINELS
ncbi:MAG: 30S ribosomal protein S20 [Flavobacteriales bacterium]